MEAKAEHDDRELEMDDDKKVKTAQPATDELSDTSYPGVRNSEHKPRPDQLDDPEEKKPLSSKITQRQE